MQQKEETKTNEKNIKETVKWDHLSEEKGLLQRNASILLSEHTEQMIGKFWYINLNGLMSKFWRKSEKIIPETRISQPHFLRGRY